MQRLRTDPFRQGVDGHRPQCGEHVVDLVLDDRVAGDRETSRVERPVLLQLLPHSGRGARFQQVVHDAQRHRQQHFLAGVQNAHDQHEREQSNPRTVQSCG